MVSYHLTHVTRRHQGFSLVELMVGMGIGLVAMLVIMQVFTMFEGQKRTTTTGSDALVNGALALHTIERDVRMAGYGLSHPDAMGCTVKSNFGGANQPDFPLVPITITNGANGLPDTVRILANAKSQFSVPARVSVSHPAVATKMNLNSTIAMAKDDMLVAYEAGKTCTLFQVTKVSSSVEVIHDNTSSWNQSTAIYPASGYAVGTTIFNLGKLGNRTYSLDAGANLLLTSFQPVTNTGNNQALFPDIVSLQAEYGFDTRAGAVIDTLVNRWSDTMIDADGNGTVGDAGDIKRMYAVRFAVVARSGIKEKPKADGTCELTTATSANRPAWVAGDIDVSKNPDGTANADWKCYRYKVYESVVPLRNKLWRES